MWFMQGLEGNNKVNEKSSFQGSHSIFLSIQNDLINYMFPGTDISTSLLALASEFLKKGLSGKYILVFTCPNRQADFQNTKHIL